MELETQQQARQASGRRTQLKLGRDIKLPSVRKLPLVRRRALPVRVIGAESVPALSAALLGEPRGEDHFAERRRGLVSGRYYGGRCGDGQAGREGELFEAGESEQVQRGSEVSVVSG